MRLLQSSLFTLMERAGARRGVVPGEARRRPQSRSELRFAPARPISTESLSYETSYVKPSLSCERAVRGGIPSVRCSGSAAKQTRMSLGARLGEARCIN